MLLLELRRAQIARGRMESAGRIAKLSVSLARYAILRVRRQRCRSAVPHRSRGDRPLRALPFGGGWVVPQEATGRFCPLFPENDQVYPPERDKRGTPRFPRQPCCG